MRGSSFLKLFVAFAVVAILVLFTGEKVQAASYETGIYIVNTSSTPLNVRSGFGSDHMKVGELAKGTKVEVTLVSDNGWGKIVYKDIHGWISLEYCKYSGPAEETSTKASSASKKSYGISAEKLKWVTGWKQEYSKSSGLCTSCATAAVLRRRQAAEGKEVTFTFGDVRAALGGNPIPDANGYYESCNSYFTESTPFRHLGKDGKPDDSETYYLIRDYEEKHVCNREYLADMLDVHPEGIVVYANYQNNGRHAIMISDYVRNSDGSLQFYAYDPANGDGRCRLEDTWMISKESGSVNKYFNNITSIWYVKGELTVDNGYFSHPEAKAYDASVTVTKKKAYTYSEADAASERVEKLEKGDSLIVCYIIEEDDGNIWYITDEGYYVNSSSVKIN